MLEGAVHSRRRKSPSSVIVAQRTSPWRLMACATDFAASVHGIVMPRAAANRTSVPIRPRLDPG